MTTVRITPSGDGRRARTIVDGNTAIYSDYVLIVGSGLENRTIQPYHAGELIAILECDPYNIAIRKDLKTTRDDAGIITVMPDPEV